jgi:hypothetical protein
MVSRVQRGNYVLVDVGQKDLDGGYVVHRAELDTVFAYHSRMQNKTIWTDTSFVRHVFGPDEIEDIRRQAR